MKVISNLLIDLQQYRNGLFLTRPIILCYINNVANRCGQQQNEDEGDWVFINIIKTCE